MRRCKLGFWGWDNKNFNSLDPGSDEHPFFTQISSLLKDSNVVPGWDLNQCSMDWGEFAGFSNWAAKQDPATLDAVDKALQANQPIPYKADPSIKQDLAYAPSWPLSGNQGVVYAGPPPGTNGVVYAAPVNNTTMIAVGIGAAVIVGGGILYALTRKKGSPSSNPTHDSTYREYVENAAWKHAPSSRKSERSGHRQLMFMNPSTGREEMTPLCEISVEDLEHAAGLSRRSR